MSNFQKQKQNALQLLKFGITLAQKYKYPGIEKGLKNSAKSLLEGKLLVVICGEFKQGKSSLINALLNENNLFPVDVDIATNLVSSITYGEQEKIKVLIGEPGKEETREISREEIANYATEQGNAENFRKAQMLVIESPNPQLKEGLVLVDTPGVGGLNQEHTVIAYAFIPNADVILFVSDALKPLTQKELDFLEMIAPHCKNFIFIVTKKDIGNYQEIIDSNREKLSHVLNCSGEEITIIPVSSKTKLAYLKSQDAEDLEDSNFTFLENQLWETLNQQRGKILIGRALQDLTQAVAEMKNPLEAEWNACQQNPEEFAEMEKQFQEAKQNLQNLQENNASWLTQLSDGLQDIKKEILEEFQEGIRNIKDKVDTALDDDKMLKNPQKIASLVEVEIDLLMSTLGKQISEKAANLHREIETYTGLDINQFEFNSLTRKKNDISVDKPKISSSEKYWNVTRTAFYQGIFVLSAGSYLGQVPVIATFLVGAAPIAIPLAAAVALAGIKIGVTQTLNQYKQKEKIEVAKIINKFIQDCQVNCQQSLNTVQTELERSMRDELKAQIKQLKQNYDRTLQSIQETRKLNKEQTERKIAELKPILQELLKLDNTIKQLAQTMESLNPQELVQDGGGSTDG
ncbi:MAG: dynamin family protein [Nostocales cyanobacterium 94392]|nr:dynamin family protein [Nostocales cyanobacterium 94392]